MWEVRTVLHVRNYFQTSVCAHFLHQSAHGGAGKKKAPLFSVIEYTLETRSFWHAMFMNKIKI